MAIRKGPAKKRPAKKAPGGAKKPGGVAGKKPAGILDNADRQLRNIRSLLEAMHQPQPDLKAAERLAAESASLEQALGTIRKHAEDLRASSQAGIQALSQLQMAAPPKRAAVAPRGAKGEVQEEAAFIKLPGFAAPGPGGGAPPSGPKLTDIFALVANGLVDAQKALDQQSLDYVAQIRDPRIAPALFAIPSVKAAAKLALTVDNQSNILVKLFGSPTDKTNYSESTLSFDIVAAPPPPDGMHAVPSFLVVSNERDQVIQKATGVAPTDDVRAHATVFRLPQVAAQPYLLILTGAAAGSTVQVYRLSLEPAAQPTEIKLPNDPGTLAMLTDIAAALKQWEQTARGARSGA
jgi:hypothetical protein